ncbi:hypothetical protein ACFSC6_02720 [Rufibacter sediminis]|uniref:Uncharacterized protein n=1 Tax=Rufibacter sediminis TaxID=2762756 RepID=A0ABR6VT14_9BACT|nr:hypothetical protein [Rufibacter sediminis]MBC3540299.1 hypothetical protein [Rufibacter sediminis]
MGGVAGFTLDKNKDLVGLKEFLNEWLLKRNLDAKYGSIKSSLDSEFVTPYTDDHNKRFPLYYENTQYIEWLEGVYSKLALERSSDQGVFYWFKPYDRALEILKEEKLHLLSLDKQDLNDHAEALEFTQRYEFFPYSQYYHHSSYGKENFPHIACFTKNFRSQKFWDDYANNETGVAFGIRIIFKDAGVFGGLKPCMLRDVFYDTGYDFNFSQ